MGRRIEGMTVEKNLRMIDAAFEAINDRDWDHLWGFHVDSIVMWTPDLRDPLKGREAVVGRLRAWAEALPDLSWKRTSGFGEGDWVCVELIIRGTHTGPLRQGLDAETFGTQRESFIPPTGKRVEIRGCAVYKVEGGEISESHIYYDQLGLMRQLGLVP